MSLGKHKQILQYIATVHTQHNLRRRRSGGTTWQIIRAFFVLTTLSLILLLPFIPNAFPVRRLAVTAAISWREG